MTPLIYSVLALQALLGAFDNLWHHELQARLPQRVSARRELALHTAREVIYGVVFLTVAWAEARGPWAVLLGGLLVAELFITLADFMEEDRTRRLPPFERLLHTVLTALYGIFLALMAPVLLAWGRSPGGLVLVDHGPVSWLFSAFALGVLAWAARNALALRSTRQAAADAAVAERAARMAARNAPALRGTPLTVLVAGGTGFVGTALVADLVRSGRRVIVLSRDVQQARGTLGPRVTVIDRLDTLPAETRIHAVVHLAGARVLGLPWTRQRRHTLLASRVDLTTELVALMRRLHHRPEVLVAASATGFYGVAPEGASMHGAGAVPVDESAAPRPGQFASDLCAAVEHEARRAEALGARVVLMRFGVILGRGDGAWPMQALAARLGLATTLGTGRQPAPWLHLDDAVGLLRLAIEQPRLAGPVNAVAPQACTQHEFAQALAAAHGRRAWLRMPAALLRALGGEMMSLMLEGQAVAPAAALAAGYRFRHADLAAACRCLAGTASVTACQPAAGHR
ncbi:TIGR01777 family oxidoreductase [Ideonella sp. BN130291]|uniref:TIGR01777 family oxidoreductase n=1 Tax=Ideonella sp. BN130291 TaxID=3112940 RepID=UPI002E270CA8|nr:TIGR01777 family oxidoreductase [Ideonella sp. BN130291]